MFCCIVSDESADVTYDWFEVGVLDYDEHYKEYFVQKVNGAGRVIDAEGQPVVNGGFGTDGQYEAIWCFNAMLKLIW